MTGTHEITSSQDLLQADGKLTSDGWARKPLLHYDRNAIKAPWFRIKEWDYYAIISHEGNYGITLTLSDLSYAALIAVCWLDFKAGTFKQLDTIKFLTRGKMNFPSSSLAGDLYYSDNSMTIDVTVRDEKRIIAIDAPAFISPTGEQGLKAQLELLRRSDLESMIIATSWKENRRAFYYNEKVNCMPVSGQVTIGSTSHGFSSDGSMGCLDWGRGNWTYRNRWFWGSLSAWVDGIPFGLNLGYGFSDRSNATENVIIYDGVIHKLDQVTFDYDSNNYMKPWKIIDNQGRLQLDFAPVVDRSSMVNFGIIASDQHQVFGRMTGKAVLDDGKEIKLDSILGFAEDVYNRW